MQHSANRVTYSFFRYLNMDPVAPLSCQSATEATEDGQANNGATAIDISNEISEDDAFKEYLASRVGK